MLGRQQIAGIPTALHELLKNAHDAYADHCEVDFLRSERILLVRDDGYGMTKQEFQDKWLALGTDSRLNANDTKKAHWTGPRGGPRRPIMGEKGIGRLAVGTIAPITIVLTRAIRPTSEGDGLVLHDLVLAVVCWKLFEIPGIDVSQIEIPIETIGPGQIPDADLIDRMIATIRSNLVELSPMVPPKQLGEITGYLDNASIDPAWVYDQLEEILGEEFPESAALSLKGDRFGTHFIMLPADDVLDADIDEGTHAAFATGIRTAPPLTKILLGFSNSTTSAAPPRLIVQFRDHRLNGVIQELIGPRNFFTPEEYESLDHHIEGSFDETGHFSGKVSQFNSEPSQYELSWADGGGRIDCGPFKIKIAYLPGNSWESHLDQDRFQFMASKLNELGGIYIYKDDIRVLPYGTTDTDFLNIERRRTLSAADWVFSYRRMIGIIQISHSANPLLQEKAGREGLRENKAFRDFRNVLENLFRMVAIDYFRATSERGGEYNAERERRKNDNEILRRRERQTRNMKIAFTQELDALFELLEAGKHLEGVDRIDAKLEQTLASMRTLSTTVLSDAIYTAERELMEEIDLLEKRVAVPRQRNIALGKKLEQELDTVTKAVDEFKTFKLEPLREAVVKKFDDLRRSKDIQLERQRRAVEMLKSEGQSSRNDLKQLRGRAEESLQSFEDLFKSTLKQRTAALSNTVESVTSEALRQNLDRLSDEEAFQVQRTWESQISQSFAEQREILENLDNQLQLLIRATTEQLSTDATMVALERRVEELSEQLSIYSDTAQAGMAVGIIGHELENVIGGVRRTLRELSAWGSSNPELKSIYTALRAYFDELDGYLRLFSPLSRRLRRERTNVQGSIIEKYVKEVFGSRLDEEGIELKVTDAFRSTSLDGFVSTFLASLVNIVDNAIYWISSDDASGKWICLDGDGESLTISNGGPGIPLRISDRIFEFGVSSKRGGRGMGLSVSKDALEKIGYRLHLVDVSESRHPTFKISKIEN
ncbi:ATP-binding protein [Rhizobium leguminosarum]|uniref:ATP-binding protein n=1 Tax=Rhizobium leguminosarum TaxID=384 RepID=UPI0013EE8A16|nr:ATP-binding protein [Rhizobium leguminosarum]